LDFAAQCHEGDAHQTFVVDISIVQMIFVQALMPISACQGQGQQGIQNLLSATQKYPHDAEVNWLVDVMQRSTS
jgi:hypothetical protein